MGDAAAGDDDRIVEPVRCTGPDRPRAGAEPHAAGSGGQAARMKDMQTRLQDTIRHHPVVLEQEAKRAADLQLRIADWITGSPGR